MSAEDPSAALAGAGVLLVDAGRAPAGLVEALAAEGALVARAPLPEDEARGDREAVARLGDALARLREDARVDAERVALVGCGSAATAAFLLACRVDGIAALVLLQPQLVRAQLDAARPFQPLEMALNLGCPLQLQYGARDAAHVDEEVELAYGALSQSARTFDIVVHPESDARFFEAGGGGPAAAVAHEGAAAFLREHLAP